METHRRVTVKLKNPNPLFKKWIQEWIDDAEKKRKRSSQVYQKALDSLKKYPLTLYSGADCAIIENFGPKICKMLDEKLEEHLKGRIDLFQLRFHHEKVNAIQQRDSQRYLDIIKNLENSNQENEESIIISDSEENCDKDFPIQLNDDVVEVPNVSREISADEFEDSFDRLINKQEKKKKHSGMMPVSHKPKFNFNDDCIATSSPIYNDNKFRRVKTFDLSHGNLASPSHVESPISKFLDVEYSNPSPVASYKPTFSSNGDTEIDEIAAKYGWTSSVRHPVDPPKIVKKKRVEKVKSNDPIVNLVRPPTTSNVITTQKSKECDDNSEIKFISIDDINPSDYDVILAVDLQETAKTTGKTSANDDALIKKLNDSSIKTDVRKLHIGDFLWIAKHKIDSSKELVLPYIIERKRLDDLAKSIKDGRYHEQKFRLQKCGVENVIYVIENMPRGSCDRGLGLPLTTLMQAATNTQIHSKFQVKFTDNLDHTIMYLTVMTTFVEKIFLNKAPVKFKMLEFEGFNKSSMKQKKLTVREAFIKQLMVLKGVSFDIAVEITRNYPTPIQLYRKYLTLDEKEGENLLSNLTVGELKRKIPKTISQTLYALYTCKNV